MMLRENRIGQHATHEGAHAMTLTADRNDAEGTAGGPEDRRWWNRRAFDRRENTDSALMIGALSIVCFWTPGFGVALGILALGAALWADRSPILSGPPASRTDAALAYGAGALGIILGIGFLTMVLW
ncbi:hypothetical protein CH293_05635 [Rhodococcus sp. 14-2470-1b]|nr:hypothetical protein CH293_05635 [Rhodococcus sp. 14-2470-1b]